jgi:DNA-binding LytR/AlgR family response regulator
MLYPKKVKQLNNFTYVIIDDDNNNGLKTKQIADSFQNLTFLASVTNYDDALDCILEHQPDLLFLEIDPSDKDSNLSLQLINELHRYLTVVPKVFVTTKNDTLALNAFKYGVYDYLLFPLEVKELRKSLFRLDKEIGQNDTVKNQQPVYNVPKLVEQNNNNTTVFPEVQDIQLDEVQEAFVEEHLPQENELVQAEVNDNPIIDKVETTLDEPITEEESVKVTFSKDSKQENKALVICVKSYGDYRYIDAKDICYLQADNNSTDIHLNTGEMITAFKTLKHFEGVLNYPFVRIHNSYILNIDYVSRIHTGNAVCHIKNTTTKLPFSKSYKENIDAIIASIASGNYIEI